MANIVFNIAKGRVVEYYNRVEASDPTNAALILVPIETSGLQADSVLIDVDSLDALLSGATNEQTTMGRKTLSDAELAALPSPDDTNNYYEISLPAVTWSAATGNAISKIAVCYDPDTTGGADTAIIPLTMFDFVVTPSGADIVMPAGAFFQGDLIMPDVGRADEVDTALAIVPLYAGTRIAYEVDTAIRPGSAFVTNSRFFSAWTFKQDEHEVYGLQLGIEGTLIWDKLTNQWCQWRSPTYGYWRAADVVDWEGYNLAGDTESGIVWQIDPTNRLDYGDTPIESKVTGYLTYRMRNQVPCFMTQLACKVGDPPSGYTDGSVGITLRTSVDNGQSFIDHGQVAGGGVNEKIAVRWYGLGLIETPGMMFEITDSGYSRRIDGLNLETAEGISNG